MIAAYEHEKFIKSLDKWGSNAQIHDLGDSLVVKIKTKFDETPDTSYLEGELLESYKAGSWDYIGVICTAYYRGYEIHSDSLWGIESIGDYWKEVAQEMIDDVKANYRQYVDEAIKALQAQIDNLRS